MNFELRILQSEHTVQFKEDMQIAFQQSAVEGLGAINEQILPESHIDRSLNAEGSVAYEAVVGGELVGGAIVVIDKKTQHNYLDFLYVKNGIQSKGIGQAIWKAIEKLHPETNVWETCTPYFEKRNIHFYVNKCGFHIVEFFNKWHKDPNDSDDIPMGDYFEGMFRFEKKMK